MGRERLWDLEKAPHTPKNSGAFFGKKSSRMSSLSFLSSLVTGTSHQLLVFMLAHLFFPFLDNTSHGITSIPSIFCTSLMCCS